MKSIRIIGLLITLYFISLSVKSEPKKTDLSEGLSMGNSSTRNNVMEFTLANRSEKTGDVVISIIQNGTEICTYAYKMNANTQNKLKLQCKGLVSGSFDRLVGWAEFFPAELSIAERVLDK